MNMLLVGLLLWSIVHFFPALARETKNRLILRLGHISYRALFSILILLALLLMVLGWRSAPVHFIYVLPEFTRPLSVLLTAVAFVLFVASKLPTRIKLFIRHPQLSSVIIWSVAHLLTCGDTRSVLLFAGLGVWAIIEIVLINKRQGEWTKPVSASGLQDLICLLVAGIVFTVVAFLHTYLSSGIPFH